MPIIRLSTADDPRIDVYRHLKATNTTRNLDQFVVEGVKLIHRLASSRFPFVSALISDRYIEGLAPCLPKSATVFVLPHHEISNVIGFNFHQGGLAAGQRLPPPDLDQFFKGNVDRVQLVASPGLQNPENLGTLIRTSDVFGIDALLLGPDPPDPLSRRVLRVSMGTALDQPVIVFPDLIPVLERLQQRERVQLIGTVTATDAVPIDKFQPADRFCVLLGSEAHGLGAEYLERCDQLVTIPMRPGAESLNLAVASGILLYELRRRSDS